VNKIQAERRAIIELYDIDIKELEQKLSILKELQKETKDDLQKNCPHPNDKVIDDGGMFGSVCTCSLCNKLISVSG